jgi:L-asparaginase
MIDRSPIQEFSLVAKPKAHLLVIYTGGTLGMDYDHNGSLVPCPFDQVIARVPVIKELHINLSVTSFNEPLDSSNVSLPHWQEMAKVIYDEYDHFDGFIVLHGTDTMAYSASALSFMLDGLNKPVIFTGAQLPIASPRSDGQDNFITSLEIASDSKGGRPIITEVCIFFNHLLLRGNRSKKVESQQFDAFESENYPVLAEAGISIDYNWSALRPYRDEVLELKLEMDPEVAILKLFPGLNELLIESLLTSDKIKGVVIESYGSGNMSNSLSFIDLLERANRSGKVLLNISQCNGGSVQHGKYETSHALENAGVLSGRDLTSEAAITKMMYALKRYSNLSAIKKCLTTSVRGEMS